MYASQNYFGIINTKDSAYWLGFLYADGCVRPEWNRCTIEISVKDECLLHKFNHDLHISNKISHRRRGSYLQITGKKIVNDLIKHGCVPRKSKVIELPKLDSRELYLAFLLGFFDGDGTQKKTVITCGSKKFLEQIKEMFHLTFGIREKISGGNIEGTRSIHGTAYEMNLGSELFNEMMDNYADSLPRKRNHFCTNVERVDLIKQNAWKGGTERKFNISKKELTRLVWEMPSERIAEKYGVSGRLITKRCEQLGIEKPSRGYWQIQHSKNKT